MCPASFLHCLDLCSRLEKAKEGGERVPWDFLSRSECVPRACGEPGLVC